MEEFIQEFKRAARGSGYKERPLVEEFKRGINGTICYRLMKIEQQPTLIKQQYNRVVVLDRNWRESKREEERLRRQQEQRPQVLRANITQVLRQVIIWPQVWPRKQKVFQQQALARSTPMEGVKRTNAAIIHLKPANRIYTSTRPIYHECGQREKLLQL